MQFLNWSAFTSKHEDVPVQFGKIFAASPRIFAARKGASVAAVPRWSTQMQFSVKQNIQLGSCLKIQTSRYHQQNPSKWKWLRRVSPKLHLMPQKPILQKDPPKLDYIKVFQVSRQFFFPPFHLNSSMDRCGQDVSNRNFEKISNTSRCVTGIVTSFVWFKVKTSLRPMAGAFFFSSPQTNIN